MSSARASSDTEGEREAEEHYTWWYSEEGPALNRYNPHTTIGMQAALRALQELIQSDEVESHFLSVYGDHKTFFVTQGENGKIVIDAMETEHD